MSHIVKQKLIGGRYSLRGPLGSGGMAEVFLAHDEVLERDVALKVLREQYAGDEGFVERFRREARSAASLSHPHIVHTYDWGSSEEGGAYYMAMEYVPGGTLKDRILAHGALPPRTAIEVASQIAEALEAAHGRGVVHRDVKPQNVLLTASGEVKVADFGIARAANATTTSQSGLIMGTAGYMAPEQAKGECAGPRSDLYSLGVVLYEMLTGEVPYEDDTPATVATKHITEPPQSPREANPEVPEEIDALTLRLLAKAPDDRYGSAAELLEDLRRVRNELPPAFADRAALPAPAVPANPGGAGVGSLSYVVYGRRFRKLPWALPAFAALLVLLGVVAWDPWSGSREQQARAQEVTREPLDAPGPAFEKGERAASSKEKEVLDTGDRSEDEGQEGSETNIGSPKVVDLDPTPDAAVLQEGAPGQDLRASIPVEPDPEIVDVSASSGLERVSVPKVSGGSVEESPPDLSDVGYVATGTPTRRGSEPAGTAVDSDSSVRSEVKRGTAMSVVVSGGVTTREGTKGGEDVARETTTVPTKPSKSRKPDKKLSGSATGSTLLTQRQRGE